MPTVQYRIVNVFADPHSAGYPFNGNPLAVVENSQGLSTEQMQAITRQLNLSETSFIGPLDGSELSIRIFSPSYELPFAGHPILGTAHIARALLGLGDQFTLKPPAGPVGVSATQDHWTLQTAQPQLSPVEARRAQLARLLGLEAGAQRDEGR
ncbi:PhzF family phenazine biosynthesis protein, partial [Chitinimonas sp.]|uniref:PhzF family phenazine biosynthesis protein n=1 Tax=Chitinimonas sp. TaxID=1934313 RepID=UPI0035B4CE23